MVQQMSDDAAPEKPGSAENRDQAAMAGCTAASLLVNGTLSSSARSFLHRESSLVDRHSLKASTNCVTILRKSWSCGVNLKGRKG